MFAISLALIVSGAVVLLMMCLFTLADLSQKWDGDTVGQSLLIRERTAETRHKDLRPYPNEDMFRSSDTFVLGGNEHFFVPGDEVSARARRYWLPIVPERRSLSN